MNNLNDLFSEFLKDSISSSKDIEYCLLQSCVEPTIRFKFGAWLNEKYADEITLNLMEANRLDLLIGLENDIYVIEFGHLLNLLQHDASLNNRKIEFDSVKIERKAAILLRKLYSRMNLEDKTIHFLICSLFSDFKVEMFEGKFKTVIKTKVNKSGTLFKYGNEFSTQNLSTYFTTYLNHINLSYDPKEKIHLTGYREFKLIPNALSLHYKFDSLSIVSFKDFVLKKQLKLI